MSVEHLTDQHRFVLRVPEGNAVLDYRLHEGGVIEFTHTFTPSTARGKGVAAQVVTAGFEYARAHGLRVIPACWYAAQFAAKHPEYADVLADDDGSPRPAPACEI